MNTEQRAKRVAFVVLVWIAILAILGLGYKFVLAPWIADSEVNATSSDSQYKSTVRLRADGFSGYAVLRSGTMKNALKQKGIRLVVKDDQADYMDRIKALREGDADMAVFTIDSLLQAGAELGGFPASIVAVIDETKGGDAIVAYKDTVPNIETLNHADAKFVLTPNSPSEFMGRIILSQFSLPNLSNDWMIKKDGAEEVYKEFVRSKGQRKAFILWEPYVTKALKEPDALDLFNSTKLTGYVVDVLVARREFLKESPSSVRAIVEAFFRASHSYGSQPNGMTELVKSDSEGLSDEEAQRTADGIQWKNVLENYGYFGVQQAPGVENLEDIIERIAGVLVQTGALSKNPVAGQASTLFFNGILAELHSEGFHPATANNVIKGVGPGADELAAARGVQTLPELSSEQWAKLEQVGNARAEPLSFLRGSEKLTIGSEQEVNDLAKRLQGLPNYYLKIVGHSRAEGNPEANKRLAYARAQSAHDRLVASGISASRLRVEAAEPSGEGGASQSVSFVLGTVPY